MDDPLMGVINNSAQFQNGMPSPQLTLLNYFVPGFSFFTSALYTYLGIDLNFYLPLLVTVFGLNFAWGYVSGQFWAFAEDYLMSSFRIRTDDEIYNMLMLWISRQKFSQTSRRFLVNTDLYSRSSFVYGPDDSDSDDDGGGDEDEEEVEVEDEVGTMVIGGKSQLHYTPSFGAHRFWYKGWPLMFERHQNTQQINFQSASEREELTISCFGRNPQILKDILHEARQMYLKKDERKTLIYRGTSSSYGDPYWQRTMARPNRPFPTVVLDDKLKQSLIDDVADYIHPATRRWYSNRGIPYRRGYLFHGPPGTGKSSLSLALAGYFRMKIYIVGLSSLTATEEGLTALFSSLPTRCLVLLEDIDTAGLTHTRDQPDSAAPEARSPISPPFGLGAAASSSSNNNSNSGGGRLSLSGLLNILDGVASKEGRILVMTTNHVDKLDKALIRPGRVDCIIPFSLADNAMTQSIFRAIYAPYEGELTAGKGPRRGRSGGKKASEKEEERKKEAWAKEHVRITDHITQLAVEFAARIPEFEFSPAEIQGLLLRYKRSPEEAIGAADEWVSDTRRDKKEKEVREAERRRREAAEEAKRLSGQKEDESKDDGDKQLEEGEAEGEGEKRTEDESKPDVAVVAIEERKNGASDSEYERI